MAVHRVKKRIYEILARSPHGDKLGRTFDVFLILLILANTLTYTLASIPSLHEKYHHFFFLFEVISVSIFLVEYLLRVWSITVVPQYRHHIWGRIRFMVSPMAIVDLLAILPLFLSGWSIDLRYVRILRLFRIFRIVKLARYVRALDIIASVLHNKKEELVLSFLIILGTLFFAANLMYVAEHEYQPDKFTSIPHTLWWSVSTLTTVGYGDVYPITNLGKFISGCISLVGVAIFALPAGIFAAGFLEETAEAHKLRATEKAKAEDKIKKE